MSNKQPNTKNIFLRNLIAGLVCVALALVLIVQLLSLFTRHNKELQVPDFTSLSVEEARSIAKQESLRIEIADSVFVKQMPLGSVFSQNPKAGSSVKKNRRIFLTINSTVPRKVAVPSLIGYSLRQAAAEISSAGLRIGRLSYVSDIATNNVLRQQAHGRDLPPGRMVESDSEVDLVLGLCEGAGDNLTSVPVVKGYTWKSATAIIHECSLNIGRVKFDDSVKDYADSLRAVVYDQRPRPGDTTVMSILPLGRPVDIYLTIDSDKLGNE
ncbi:MAG: PASTA domain-containing protein [Bacteroidales bacterium]|nr:PASTA domain-containing protein [Bacteroidales bacterium]